MRRRWVSSPAGRVWPDGWLAGVPALAERRGSAPATVAALSRIEDPHSLIATPSRGCHADSVACVTGALLGAVHGAEALPAGLVSRHELAWALDTLARDLTAQIDDSPSGSEYIKGWDPNWWDRYPGW
ncbi:hypothetical protein [Streptomyces sp. NPDC013455]|uniref:hypothetical protein n=1 Tax=Streptomyces sp. NPDC013455 TaxID=3155605 RepID=UPI0033E7E503